MLKVPKNRESMFEKIVATFKAKVIIEKYITYVFLRFTVEGFTFDKSDKNSL